MPHVAHLLVTVVALSSVAAARRLLLDESRVRPVLSSIMRCSNISTLRVAVVQEGGEAQTLRLRLNDGNVEDISHDDEMLAIGSITKGMFGTALPLIEQRLRRERNQPQLNILTTPLKQLLGDDFWFLDHGRTEQVTLQDLVSHTAGLDSRDSLWLMQAVSSAEELARFASRQTPRLPFRASYIYNNLAFALADVAVRQLTNSTFADYMRSELWRPLQMHNTSTAAEMKYPGNDMRNRSLELQEAAGGVVATLDDMVKYIGYQLRSYSSSSPQSGHFTPVNAHTRDRNIRSLFAENVTGFPEWSFDNYGYGWHRTRYRDELDIYHSGSYFTFGAQLDLFVNRRLGIFLHANLGDPIPPNAAWQANYVTILSKYFADLLLLNRSYITEANACSLFRPGRQPQISELPIRQLSPDDVSICSGSFGNFGIGVVKVSEDRSSGLLVATFGIGELQLIPMATPGDSSGRYEFLVNIVSPQFFAKRSQLLARNSTHVTLSGGFGVGYSLTITAAGGAANLSSAVIEFGVVLQKDLDPSAWRRPPLCSRDSNSSDRGRAAGWLLLLLLAAAAVAAEWRISCLML